MTDEPKTSYTPEEVEQLLIRERIAERRVSALVTSIQRSIAAGDAEIYTNALKGILAELTGMPPQPPQEKPAEESTGDEQ